MPDRPNILLFFTDQQRADSIGALGNPVVRTPHLDRLCREGTAFSSAYSPCPVCVPARCSMHYGQYPSHSGSYENGYPMPTDGRQSFMDALSDAGYHTHGIGKCHFSPDAQAMRGFRVRERQEEIVGSIDNDDYMKFLFDNGFDHLTDPHGVRGEMYYVPQVAQVPARLHPTQWVGDRTLAFLEERQSSKEPWFLFSSFIHPHPPFAPPAPWHKLYRGPAMPLPNTPADMESLRLFINRRQNRYKYRDQGIDQNLLRVMKAYYYGCVSFIDYQIGRVLEALEKSGQLDNTLVLFTSDHGEYLGDYHCFGKRGPHDACCRIPLLARFPARFEAGARCARPSSLVDILPTVLNAGGAALSSHAPDGVDLADLASGASDRDMVGVQFETGDWAWRMAVTEDWKYLHCMADAQPWLFDRRVDPGDTRNHCGVHFYREAEAMMKERLVGWMRDMDDTDILDGDSFRPSARRDIPASPDDGLLVQDHGWADHSIPGYTD